ncbi:enoyl-CoA hydratase [Paraflavitalea soli]|uniref:Enoyl-CoA hydratase n=1 Tax=Paraflavitalea soli TaxID=2315862 RepID=A0A3B7MVU1_9BACT|nr:enoyl-CoA hydratase-related protein [Paraflavitalea soli]AXY77329.1 enoyl-CoA hydratase [Paraflavitalea soli]
MYETLLVEVEQHICIITINRPDKLNAINKTVMEELSKAIDEVYNNTNIKSAIITGSGGKAFVAGADITEFQGLSKEQGMALAKKGHDIFFKIENAPKPIVAAVNGFALGGGCELALSCHFMIASDNAKFGQPEVNLGLIPGYGGTQRLVQVAGKGRAMELLMSGKMITAKEAQSYGLVNEVVTPEALLPKVKEILQTIQSKAPIAIANIIECINNFDHTQKGYDLEVQKFGECFATEDMQEGAAAFLEKRKPVFKGK